MATRITNVSGGALTLPPPYGGVLPWGGSAVVGDAPSVVTANLGSAFGNNVKVSLDTVDAAQPAFDNQQPAAPRYLTGAISATPATLSVKEAVALVNVGSAATVNLPTPPIAGETHKVKDTSGAASTNNITVKTTDGTTIDGGSGGTGVAISTNYGFKTFLYDGTQWWTV